MLLSIASQLNICSALQNSSDKRLRLLLTSKGYPEARFHRVHRSWTRRGARRRPPSFRFFRVHALNHMVGRLFMYERASGACSIYSGFRDLPNRRDIMNSDVIAGGRFRLIKWRVSLIKFSSTRTSAMYS